MRKIALALLVALGVPLFASIKPSPGSFGVDVEYLYWHPMYEGGYFVEAGVAEAFLSPTTPGENIIPLGVLPIDRIANKFNWQSAVRVDGVYAFCNGCNDIRLMGTWLETDHSKVVEAPVAAAPALILAPAVGPNGVTFLPAFQGSASSYIKLKYYAIDLLFDQDIYNYNDCCSFDLSIQGGLQYGYIKLDQNISYLDNTSFNDLDQSNRVWGIGPEIGFDFRYSLTSLFSCACNPLFLTTNGRAGLLFGESKTKGNFSAPGSTEAPSEVSLNEDSLFRSIPFGDIRLGLSYDFCFSCVRAQLEIGYEFLTYLNAIHETVYESSIELNSTDFYKSLTFQGPFARLGLAF